MLTRFTSRSFVALSSVLLLVAQGCATVDVASVDRAAAVAKTPWPQAAAKIESLPEWRPDAVHAPEDVASPKVHRRNVGAFEQAVTALRRGHLQEAEVLLLEITADQPELAGPWVNLGQVYSMLEQFEDARMAFQSAVTANPRSCAAHNQLGVLSRQIGDFRGAEEHYRSCLEQVPNFGFAHLNLGILYELYLGRLPEALEAYRRYQILAAEPDRKVQGWVVDLERRLGV
ncbi:MAG: tetratricopeptide repeat protein [Gammaproteobacteria bacterium]|nr:tetratricopeptide repeat protein [Gammaproteobacteria bacterium]